MAHCRVRQRAFGGGRTGLKSPVNLSHDFIFIIPSDLGHKVNHFFLFLLKQDSSIEIFSQHDQEILSLHLKHQLSSASELEFFSSVSNYWYLLEFHFPLPRFLLVLPVFVFH